LNPDSSSVIVVEPPATTTMDWQAQPLATVA
jgi:hypothetical protein